MTSNGKKANQINWKDRFSFTQISTYLNCPRQFWFQYRAKAPRASNENLILGSAVHSAIAYALELTRNGNRPAPKSIQDVWELTEEQRQKLKDDWKLLPKGPGMVGFPELLRRFDNLFEAWALEILPILSPQKIEEPFAIEYQGIKLGGFIDLVDERKGVIDWKVTSSRKENGIEHSLQLALYAFVTNERKVGFGSLVKPSARLRDLSKWVPKVYLDTTTLTDEMTKWAMGVIIETTETINCDKIFPRCSPESYLCRSEYCDFWGVCRGATHNNFWSPKSSNLKTEEPTLFPEIEKAPVVKPPKVEPKKPRLRKSKVKPATTHWLDAIELSTPLEPGWLAPIEATW